MNQDCYERNRNESVLNRNVYLSYSNANDRDITNEKNSGSKKEFTIRDDPSNKRKGSVHADQMVHKEPGDSLILSDQGSNKNTQNSSNNIVFFDDSIPKGINIKNLKSRLCNANCSCRFSGGATSKYFHHYIRPTLNETDMITDIAVLHMGTNDIINSEVNKDLVADSIINVARECVAFGVKSVFISRLTVNTRRNSAFISAVNKTLKAKCFMHNFHFIDNSNIKKEHLWKDGLHLNRSGKDLLTNNFLRDINNVLKNLKYQEIVT